jgi:hypothetical protein
MVNRDSGPVAGRRRVLQQLGRGRARQGAAPARHKAKKSVLDLLRK